MSRRSATSGDGIAGDSQVPPAPTQEGELIVGQQSRHPRECTISFGQWAVAFLDVAERANSNPQALTCPICGSSFLHWKRGPEHSKYAGKYCHAIFCGPSCLEVARNPSPGSHVDESGK